MAQIKIILRTVNQSSNIKEEFSNKFFFTNTWIELEDYAKKENNWVILTAQNRKTAELIHPISGIANITAKALTVDLVQRSSAPPTSANISKTSTSATPPIEEFESLTVTENEADEKLKQDAINHLRQRPAKDFRDMKKQLDELDSSCKTS